MPKKQNPCLATVHHIQKSQTSMQISQDSKLMVASFMCNACESICREITNLMNSSGRKTVMEEDVQEAILNCFPCFEKDKTEWSSEAWEADKNNRQKYIRIPTAKRMISNNVAGNDTRVSEAAAGTLSLYLHKIASKTIQEASKIADEQNRKRINKHDVNKAIQCVSQANECVSCEDMRKKKAKDAEEEKATKTATKKKKDTKKKNGEAGKAAAPKAATTKKKKKKNGTAAAPNAATTKKKKRRLREYLMKHASY